MRGQRPVDVCQCLECTRVVEEEAWALPLQPIRMGRCMNCGGSRDDDRCAHCDLSIDEDRQLHEEMRELMDDVDDWIAAARTADGLGRRVLALKLATAGAFERGEAADEARALRIWLLSTIGCADAAVEDCRTWVAESAEPSALACASLGQQLEHADSLGEAAEAYLAALRITPSAHAVRARRARVLWNLGRVGQALDECLGVLSSSAVDGRTAHIAIEVAELLCDRFKAESQSSEIQRLLNIAEAYVPRSAELLLHRAALAEADGDASAAKKDRARASGIGETQPSTPTESAASGWWRR